MRAGGSKTKPDEPPDNYMLPFHFIVLCVFRKVLMLKDRVKPSRRAPGSSECGTPSITSILFLAQRFLWEATQQLRLAVFPLRLSRRTSNCRHHLFVLALAHPFLLPPSTSNMSEEESKTLCENSSSSRFPPTLMNNRSLAPPRRLIVLCFDTRRSSRSSGLARGKPAPW